MTVQADIERDRALKAAAYWREQYERAAHALQRARTGMSMTPTRRAVLAKLGDLKPGQCLSARVLSELMGWMNTGNTRRLLLELQGFGWVDQVPSEEKQKGIDVGYRLGLLAIAPEFDDSLVRHEEPAGLPLWQPV